jgi:hypothetical protein
MAAEQMINMAAWVGKMMRKSLSLLVKPPPARQQKILREVDDSVG